MRATWPCALAILGATHLRPGHLSTIVSPGEQSQVREGGSCHDPRPTDGGHGNPFSFSGKWARPAQARGLHAEYVDPGPQVACSKCSVEPRRRPFRMQHQETIPFLGAHRSPGAHQSLVHCPLFLPQPKQGIGNVGVKRRLPLVVPVM